MRIYIGRWLSIGESKYVRIGASGPLNFLIWAIIIPLSIESAARAKSTPD